jgi:uncharacterized protein
MASASVTRENIVSARSAINHEIPIVNVGISWSDTTSSALHVHPKIGASWEGYVVEKIIKALQPDAINFWATHQGAELDLFLPQHHGKRIGFEIKRADAPQMTKSMHIAMADLRLDRLLVIYPGSSAYALSADRRISVVPAADIAAWHPRLRF